MNKDTPEFSTPHCPLCRADESRPLFTREGRSFFECAACGLIFQDPPPSREANLDFYRTGYYEKLKDRNPGIQEARRSLFARALRDFRVYRKTGRLLDVGSGFGDFLKAAETGGWEAWGIEPSREAGEASQRMFGSRVLNQAVETADFPAGRFDVITMWNVVDCLEDPLPVIKQLHRWLRPGGLLWIRTPNTPFHLWIYRVYCRWGPLWAKLGWKREASVFLRANFDAKTLTRLLNQSGFSGIRIRNGEPTQGDPYAVFSYGGFVSLAKTLIYGFSRLVEFLTARRVRIGSNLVAQASRPSGDPLLVVTVDFPPQIGGVSTIAKELARRLSEKSSEVTVLCPGGAEDREQDGLHPYRTIRLPGYRWGFLRILPFMAVLPFVLLRYRIRKVFALNVGYGGLLSWMFSSMVRLEYLVFAYGYEFEKIKKIGFLVRLYQKIYARAREVVTCSEEIRRRLIRFGVEPSKIRTLYPSVDFERFKPMPVPKRYLEERNLAGRRILLSVGRLIERKGQDQIIRALPKVAARFPEVLCCFVGEGPHEKRLREEVRSRGLEDFVRFLGRVSESELPLLYNAGEIFVMPSREIAGAGHIEGFGIVFLEASASGRPVIGGRSGGVAEAVLEGETGFLVDPLSADELADRILFLLSHPEKAAQMGQRGFQWVRENFSWDRYADAASESLSPRRAKEAPHVIHVITRMTRGGAQENTLATVSGLRERGYRVTLVTGPSEGREGEILSEALSKGLDLVILPELIRDVSPFRDLAALWKLRSLFQKSRCEIVHTHTSKAGFLGRLAARLAGVPLVVHTPHGHIFHSYFSPLPEKCYLLLERLAAAGSDALIALTDRCRREHLELKVGCEKQWLTIPSGVNPKAFAGRPPAREAFFQAWRIPAGKKIFGFVGRLAPVKGTKYLIEALPEVFKNVPDSHCLVVGDGEEFDVLHARVKELGLEGGVTFTGARPDTFEFMSAMDVLAVPSLNEGMGRVIVQAGFLEKAVVGTNVGGIPDLIATDETGILVEPRDPRALARALVRLLKDPPHARALGRALHERVLKDFTEDKMLDKIDRLYGRLLENKGLLEHLREPLWVRHCEEAKLIPRPSPHHL